MMAVHDYRVSPDEIDKTDYVDLISAAVGGRVIAYSDQFFADASNLLTATSPIHQPGKMVFTGAWYDGWETRRHNPAPFDWVVVRLGVSSGTVAAIEVDTAFFTGNYPPAISVEGCTVSTSDVGAEDVLVAGRGGSQGDWETILPVRECGPSRRHCWCFDRLSSRAFTHVRLCMYPDGGIARFRLYGRAVPVFPADPAAELDLAAVRNGGVAVACSDQHFGARGNLLLPGRGHDMSDGWETARSRVPNHMDWAIIRLGTLAHVRSLVVDTAHYRGNFPQRVRVEAIHWQAASFLGPDPSADHPDWTTVVSDSPCGPDQECVFPCAVPDMCVTHVKLVMIPDGGVKRLRVLGSRVG